MRYQDCIFDLYGTLVDIHTDESAPRLWEAMGAYYRKRGAEYQLEELRRTYFEVVAEAEQRGVSQSASHEAHPEIQLEQVFQKLFQVKGVDADLEEAIQAGRRFRELSTEYIRLYPGAKELLWELRGRGCGVWLLSNAQSMFTMWELERLGLTACFNGICLSSDYGVKKPDRRFFDILLQGYGIKPENAVMIGNDGLCDIQGGQRAGLSTIYIRSNLSPGGPLPDADYILTSMDMKEVLEILTGNKHFRQAWDQH